jgi:GT2 family glycosyltransferase
VSIVTHYAATDERVTLIRGEQRLGMIKNWNSCLKLAETLKIKYFMLLFHDDFLLSQQSLEKAFEILENHPEIATIYSDMVFVDECGKSIMSRKFGNSGLIEPNVLTKQSILSGRNLFGIPLLIRYDKPLEVDERLHYVGDIDLSIMSAGKMKVYRIPEPLIAYRVHGSNATHELFQQTLRQMQLLVAKHHISLSRYEKMKMRWNCWWIVQQKRLFFFYLKGFRT